MHFHLPKPLHGWRQFAGEIAIIVIGVLIALGAENLIERWHWREEADTANEAFRDELLSAAGVAYERLIIQPCLQGRIRQLSDQLGENTRLWKASPMAGRNKLYVNVMPVVYRAPTRPLPTDGWKNALGNGTLNHLPSAHVRQLSALYNQLSEFEVLQSEEAKAAASLTPLGFDRALDDDSRTNMLASLAEVDRINSLMALDASQMIEAVRDLHLKFRVALVETGRRQIVSEQRAMRGMCVADLPLILGSEFVPNVRFPPKADIRLVPPHHSHV